VKRKGKSGLEKLVQWFNLLQLDKYGVEREGRSPAQIGSRKKENSLAGIRRGVASRQALS